MKTRNIIIPAMLAFFALVMSIDTRAQSKVWSIGPESGVSISQYGMDASSNNAKPGAILGGFVTYSIVNNFAITSKFLYYQKGASFESTNTKQTLHYFEMPIVGRFFLNKSGDFRPNFFVGPSFGYLHGGTNRVNNDEYEEISSLDDTYNRADLGLTGGFGFNFRIYNETYLVLDARYTHGLSDISKASGTVNNNSLALTAGVSFGF